MRHPLKLDTRASALCTERMQHAPEALQFAAEPSRSDQALVARAAAHLEGAADPVGAAVVADLLDRLVDLDRAAGSLRHPGGPNDDWAIFQLALFGTGEAADLLEARIPRWGGRQPGITHVGLETLAAFGAKTAFAPLYRLSRGKMKPHFKKLAAEQCATVATRLGAEPEPPADRCAPTLGLDDPTPPTATACSRSGSPPPRTATPGSRP